MSSLSNLRPDYATVPDLGQLDCRPLEVFVDFWTANFMKEVN